MTLARQVVAGLSAANPWWAGGHGQLHPMLANRLESGLNWEPPGWNELPEGDRLVLLQGPRGAGRTTTLLEWVRRATAHGQHGQQPAAYLPVGLLRDPVDLLRVLRAIPRDTAPRDAPWLVCLDDVLTVRDWGRALEAAYREGVLQRGDIVVASGSFGAEEDGASTSAPSNWTRTDTTPTQADAFVPSATPGDRPGVLPPRVSILQLPLSPRDVLRMRLSASRPENLPHGPLPPSLDRISDLFTEPGWDVALRLEAEVPDGALSSALAFFRSVGGFPDAIQAAIASRTGESTAVARRLWSAVAADLERQGHTVRPALMFLERVAMGLGVPLSWVALTKAMGVGSPNTAREYGQALTDAFALLPVYYRDRGTGALAPQKRRKVFVTDPAFAWLPHRLEPALNAPTAWGLDRCIVAMALFRATSGRAPQRRAAAHDSGVACWRSAVGTEHDFVVNDRETVVVVHVTGDDPGRLASARQAIHAVKLPGICLTESTWAFAHRSVSLPLAVFVMLLPDLAVRPR
jgi:predicted AAA+ superfamily ATPase